MLIFANRRVPIDMRENNKEILFARTFSLLLTHNIGDLTLDEVEKFTGFTLALTTKLYPFFIILTIEHEKKKFSSTS